MRCSLVSCQDVELEMPHFYLATVAGEITNMKEFIICICRFEKYF